MNQLDIEHNNAINFWELFESIVSYWKIVVVGGIVGVLLATGLYSISSYTAKANVMNNMAIDYITARNLKIILPVLAAKILNNENIKNPNELKELRKLSNDLWWEKGFLPTYAISKTDSKEFIPQSTDLRELGATKILSFSVSSSAKTREEAIANVQLDARFFQTGATYFALKTRLIQYESVSINEKALYDKNRSDIDIALVNLKNRELDFKQLISIHKEELIDKSAVQLLSGAGAGAGAGVNKFLPLKIQLIAIQTDIFTQNEQIAMLEGYIFENSYLGSFVKKAMPLVDSQLNGIQSAEALLKILNEDRNKLDPKDINTLRKINDISNDIVQILTSYRYGLTLNIPTKAVKSRSLIKLVFIGAFMGFFIALIGVFIHKSWSNYKQRSSSPMLL